MKIVKVLSVSTALILSACTSLSAQKKNKGEWVTLEIKTSAQCEMCKEKIETRLMETKGIKSAVLDMSVKVVSVRYNTAKTDPEKIRKVITGLGYDADEMKADESVYKTLPGCCKKPE
jgi:copper chaperone CopZ